MSKQKIIAVVGPTASGKTSLGIFLAQKFGGEVVSADSRQVYKGLDIGTGKVTKKEMAGVPHHLLDVANPKKVFTADDFVKQGNKAIEKILGKNRVPIVVGGTGFYIDALLGRMTLANVPPNPTLRKKLSKKSATQLYAMLKKLDAKRAKSIDAKNPIRLIRAIEVARAKPGADPVAELVDVARVAPGYITLWIGINPAKAKLQKNIHVRLRTRMKAGMVGEAIRLKKQGLTLNRMHELGLEYRSLARYLKKEISKEELVLEIERMNNHYAKRQMTWFKRNKKIHWVKNKTEAAILAKKFITSGR